MRTMYRRVMRAVARLVPFREPTAPPGSRRRRWQIWRTSLTHLEFTSMVRLDVPWWSLTASEQVERFLAERPDATVFEWGSGASTVWLAARAGRVVTVEHHPGWADRVRQVVPDHVDVVTVEPEPAAGRRPAVRSRRLGHRHLDFARYVDTLARSGERPDLIVVDGRARDACLRAAAVHLADGGMIVLDNAARRRYRRAVRDTAGAFTVDHHWGLTPGSPYPTVTAVLRRR